MYKGVKQGCVLSTDLVLIYSEIVMRAKSDMESIKVNWKNIDNIRYVDGTAHIAVSENLIQNIMNKVVTESFKLGLSFKL